MDRQILPKECFEIFRKTTENCGSLLNSPKGERP
jgi:hypothetical protein